MTASTSSDVLCGECGSPMVLKDSRYGKFFGCTRFPECRGTHGATPDGKPKGIPADKATREARMRAHAAFDPLWKDAPAIYAITETGPARDSLIVKLQKVAKGRAYRWLEHKLGLSPRASHMSSWDAKTCDRVVEICAGVTARDIREWAKENRPAGARA